VSEAARARLSADLQPSIPWRQTNRRHPLGFLSAARSGRGLDFCIVKLPIYQVGEGLSTCVKRGNMSTFAGPPTRLHVIEIVGDAGRPLTRDEIVSRLDEIRDMLGVSYGAQVDGFLGTLATTGLIQQTARGYDLTPQGRSLHATLGPPGIV
jgi:hypothetical protein